MSKDTSTSDYEKFNQLSAQEKEEALAELEKQKINFETAKIPWQDLQQHFASGKVIQVDKSLDLVTTASTLQQDQAMTVKEWMEEGKIHPVADEQALKWFENKSSVWAVVVRPWVLVQEI